MGLLKFLIPHMHFILLLSNCSHLLTEVIYMYIIPQITFKIYLKFKFTLTLADSQCLSTTEAELPRNGSSWRFCEDYQSEDVNEQATENLWSNLPHSKPNLLRLHHIL